MWNKEDVEQAWEAWRKEDNGPRDGVMDRAMHRVMTRAVELAAARGGMTPRLKRLLENCEDAARTPEQKVAVENLLQVGDALRAALARNAVLEAEVTRLRASANELQHQRDSRGEALEVLEAERDAMRAELADFMDAAKSDQQKMDALTAELDRLKANHPAPSESSGQVAEDVALLFRVLATDERISPGEPEAALSRLAAGAQRAEKMAAQVSQVVRERDGLLAGMDLIKAEVDAIRKRSLEAANLERMLSEKALPATMRWVVEGSTVERPANDAVMNAMCSADVDRAMAAALSQCVACGEEPATPLEQDPPALGETCVEGITYRTPQTHPHAFTPDEDGLDVCEHVHAGNSRPCGFPSFEHRWPCSPSCIHDDAKEPDHPERVKERSEAFMRVSSELPDATERDLMRLLTDAREEGAKAMRAACWEAVLGVCGRYGLGQSGLIADLKAAIEGATP